MGEELQYYPIQPDQTPATKDILHRSKEMHELAADIQHIGGLAMGSEADAARLVGAPAIINVPNPVAGYRESRSLASFYGKGKQRHERVAGLLEAAELSLDELQASISAPAVDDANNITLSNSRGIQLFRGLSYAGNRELVFEGADIAPFLSNSKDLTAKQQGKDPSTYSWHEWFWEGTEAQLTNFSQWYTEQLKVLADPEQKNAFVASLKDDYKSRIGSAIDAGWIEPGLAKNLKEVDAADIRFFSPFGHTTDHFAGVAQHKKGEEIILLPNIVGRTVVVHEFGHIFASIKGDSIKKHFTKVIGKDPSVKSMSAIGELYTILNEGFNDHMTAALITGAPEVISPVERAAQGIPEVKGAAGEVYKSYREVFGALIGGQDGQTNKMDISEVISVIASRDFSAFAKFTSEKWGDRDIMSELVAVITEHQAELMREPSKNNFEQNQLLLSDKILTHLRMIQ